MVKVLADYKKLGGGGGGGCVDIPKVRKITEVLF